jgi:Ran GTPase-activating protein 1
MFTGRLKDEIPLALDAFVEVLENKKHLYELDLSDNAFGPAGAKPLMRLLINNRNIQVLKLNNNGLGIEGARLIASALIDAHKKNVEEGVPDQLRVIVAGRNRMESPGVGHLSAALEAFKDSLQHIQMPQNSIRPEGIAQLVNSIKNCSKLEFLDLQDNTFTEPGSKALAEALPLWPELKVLNLGDCLLSANGGVHVIKALTAGNTKLERIALFFNEINEKGAKLVPEMLKNKESLKSIELNGNNFEGEGSVAQAIRDTLRSMEKEDCLDELDEMELESDEDDEEDEEYEEKPEKPSVSMDDLADRMGAVQLQK